MKNKFYRDFQVWWSIQGNIIWTFQQSDHKQYPLSYKKNKPAYFLYEEPLNHTKEEFTHLKQTVMNYQEN